MPSNDQEFQRVATIIGFENTNAVLQVDDTQVLRWPIKKLPNDVREGMVMHLRVSNAHSEEAEREQLKRDIINTLLQG
ncbi:MAG: hypothetical protein PHY34_03435 [Patescibacteria group bacterium]|nr:hypothetical protein [Patescibacteria group bacterium]MDD5715664.1 hypothetical protein [Patescibacteria group bacterium]